MVDGIKDGWRPRRPKRKDFALVSSHSGNDEAWNSAGESAGVIQNTANFKRGAVGHFQELCHFRQTMFCLFLAVAIVAKRLL